MVFGTRAATVGLPTALSEEWSLGGLEGSLKSAPTVERAIKRSAASSGHESRNC